MESVNYKNEENFPKSIFGFQKLDIFFVHFLVSESRLGEKRSKSCCEHNAINLVFSLKNLLR